MNGDHIGDYNPDVSSTSSSSDSDDDVTASDKGKVAKGKHSYRLEELAYTRSGDKGNHCNVGKAVIPPTEF